MAVCWPSARTYSLLRSFLPEARPCGLGRRSVKAIDLAHEPVGALQGEVASAIAREIRIQVSPKEKRRLAQSRRVKPEAYRAYSYGRYCWNKRAVPRY